MLAHYVAAKAVRDAAFLSTWGASHLPAMVIATAIGVVAAVPGYARLMARFSPRRVVPVGFLVSAVAHVVEWQLGSHHPWVAVAIYLHVAGLSALLLSGFWSLLSELFDPRAAKASYGRIAAAGALGGLVGGFGAERIAATLPADAALVFLAIVHVACAAGVLWLGRAPVLFPDRTATAAPSSVFAFNALRASPHLKSLALLVVVGTAGAAILDYLLKMKAAVEYPAPTDLLRFFAWFYAIIQILVFLMQSGVGYSLGRFRVGRTISALPAGVGIASAAALIGLNFWFFVAARGIESVLRGSMFRSGYELMFVPMHPDEKRRMKTFLDITCDYVGEAMGAAIVQVALIAGFAAFVNPLLAIVIALALAGMWLARRLDATYVRVVENELRRHGEDTPLVLASETGWTVLELPPTVRGELTARDVAPTRQPAVVASPAHRDDDPRIRSLADLRSGDRQRVERALQRLSDPDRTHVAQIVQLLAWDDIVASARHVLEKVAPAHVGLLVDELLDPATDFAIRRRIPRILGTVSSDRALDGLLRGLDDSRFEVRYQCGRAIDRILSKNPGLTIDTPRIMAVVERELSVPPQVWHGYRLIDRDDESGVQESQPERAQQNLEHVFALLMAVLPRDPLHVALRGIRSDNPGLRGLAVEYLDSVLSASIRGKLWSLLGAGSKDPASM